MCMNLFYDDFLFLSIDWQSIDPEKFMKKISVVFQEVYLFQDTIANNIRYGKMPLMKKLNRQQNWQTATILLWSSEGWLLLYPVVKSNIFLLEEPCWKMRLLYCLTKDFYTRLNDNHKLKYKYPWLILYCQSGIFLHTSLILQFHLVSG